MNKKVTSIEVAELAGVSQSTVSRVFSNNSPNVSDRTRQRVLKVAEELGYQPNAIARMMSTRQSNIVGIVMANITSPFYPYVLEKFLQELQNIERQVLLFTASENQSIDDILPLVLQYQLDALIVTSATLSSELAKVCSARGMPIILFNRSVNDPNMSAVSADNVAGGRLVANVLLDTGHRRLAFVAGVHNTSTSYDRERGFFSRLHERGYEGTQQADGHYTYEGGYRATETLLRSVNPPDAIFCANDIMALGAIDALRAHGLRVPHDVSVIGFDNIPMAGWSAYQLTTISQEVDIMIQHTLQIMLEKIEYPHSPSRLERVAGNLVIRSSVRNV